MSRIGCQSLMRNIFPNCGFSIAFLLLLAAVPWAFVFMFKKWKFDRNVFLFESCKCKTFQHLGQMSKMSDDGSILITA